MNSHITHPNWGILQEVGQQFTCFWAYLEYVFVPITLSYMDYCGKSSRVPNETSSYANQVEFSFLLFTFQLEYLNVIFLHLHTWVVERLQGRWLGFLSTMLLSAVSNSYSSSGNSRLSTPMLLWGFPKHNTRFCSWTCFPKEFPAKSE